MHVKLFFECGACNSLFSFKFTRDSLGIILRSMARLGLCCECFLQAALVHWYAGYSLCEVNIFTFSCHKEKRRETTVLDMFVATFNEPGAGKSARTKLENDRLSAPKNLKTGTSTVQR